MLFYTTKVAEKIPVTNLVDPTMVEMGRTGMLASTIQVDGVYAEALSKALDNNMKITWAESIKSIGSEVCVYCHVMRHKINVELEGEFNSDFTKNLNDKYHSRFKGSNKTYANDLFITLVLKGKTSGKADRFFSFISKIMQRISTRNMKLEDNVYRKNSIESLTKVTDSLVMDLSEFGARKVGLHNKEAYEALEQIKANNPEDYDEEYWKYADSKHGFSELLMFYQRLVNCGNSSPVAIPDEYTVEVFPRGNGIAHQLFNAHKGLMKYFCEPPRTALDADPSARIKYPAGNISSLLAFNNIEIGDFIRFTDYAGNVKFSAMIGIKTYPKQTVSKILDALIHLDSELTITATFAAEKSDIASGKIELKQNRLSNEDTKGVTELNELNNLMDEVDSGDSVQGMHHYSVMIMGESIDRVKKIIVEVESILRGLGFTATHETANANASFYAQIPGNMKYVARARMISNWVFADMFPMHNFLEGYRDGNHLGQAVSIIETPSQTPVYFNFHEQEY